MRHKLITIIMLIIIVGLILAAIITTKINGPVEGRTLPIAAFNWQLDLLT